MYYDNGNFIILYKTIYLLLLLVLAHSSSLIQIMFLIHKTYETNKIFKVRKQAISLKIAPKYFLHTNCRYVTGIKSTKKRPYTLTRRLSRRFPQVAGRSQGSEETHLA